LPKCSVTRYAGGSLGGSSGLLPFSAQTQDSAYSFPNPQTSSLSTWYPLLSFLLQCLTLTWV
jgi:hypothetical protein